MTTVNGTPEAASVHTPLKTRLEDDGDQVMRRKIYLHPPLPVWKLILLMVATLSTYQLRWAYRSAKELNRTGRERLAPWLWIFAFIGPLVLAIALGRMGAFHSNWERDVTGKASAGWITPTAVLAGIVAQVALLLADQTLHTFVYLLLGAAILPAVSIALLQSRLNRIKGALDADAFHYPGDKLTRLQWCVLIPGIPLAIALFALIAYNDIELKDAERIGSGEIIELDGARLSVEDRNWYRVPRGYLGDDTDLEIVARDLASWGVIYEQDSTVNEVVDYRSDAIAQDPTMDSCESSIDMDDSLRASGRVKCRGRAALAGTALFITRVVETDRGSVEIVTYGEATGSRDTRALEARLEKLAAGLEATIDED